MQLTRPNAFLNTPLNAFWLGLALTSTLPSTVASASELELALTSARAQYALGEPIELTLSLENATAVDAETLAQLDPQFGDFELFIAAEGEDFRHYLGPDWSIVDFFARPRTLTPGESLSHSFSVLWNRTIPGASGHIESDFACMQAGRHRLRVRLLDGREMHDSNTIEIEVTEPAGSAAVFWQAMQTTPDLARVLQRPDAVVRPQVVEQLAALARQHPDTALAERALNALAARRTKGTGRR